MLATLDDFDRIPRILRLNLAGQPVDWVSWQDAVCLYARRLVVWTHGESTLRIRGGHSRRDGRQTSLEVHSIIACDGRVVAMDQRGPPLTNKALFARDHNLCLYCGGSFPDLKLTRNVFLFTSRMMGTFGFRLFSNGNFTRSVQNISEKVVDFLDQNSEKSKTGEFFENFI